MFYICVLLLLNAFLLNILNGYEHADRLHTPLASSLMYCLKQYKLYWSHTCTQIFRFNEHINTHTQHIQTGTHKQHIQTHTHIKCCIVIGLNEIAQNNCTHILPLLHTIPLFSNPVINCPCSKLRQPV